MEKMIDTEDIQVRLENGTSEENNIQLIEKEIKAKNKKKIITLSICCVIALVAVTIWLFINSGYTIRRVASSSMEPEIHKGAICIIQKGTFDDIKIGDIICATSNDKDIIHRVIVIRPVGNVIHFYTKGDANSQDDSIPVIRETYIGKVRTIIQL